MKKVIAILLITGITISSCASFSDEYTNGNILKLDNANQLSGRYNLYADKKYGEKGSSKTLNSSEDKQVVYNLIENKMPNIKIFKISDISKEVGKLFNQDLKDVQWSEDDFMEVKVNGEYVSFDLMQDNKSVKKFTLKGTKKKDFIYFPKENNCVKIPFVISGCIKTHVRIGKDLDNGLLIQRHVKIKSSNSYISLFLKYYGSSENQVFSYDKFMK